MGTWCNNYMHTSQWKSRERSINPPGEGQGRREGKVQAEARPPGGVGVSPADSKHLGGRKHRRTDTGWPWRGPGRGSSSWRTCAKATWDRAIAWEAGEVDGGPMQERTCMQATSFSFYPEESLMLLLRAGTWFEGGQGGLMGTKKPRCNRRGNLGKEGVILLFLD